MKTNHLLLITLLYAFPSYGMQHKDVMPLTPEIYLKIIEAASKRVFARNEQIKSSPYGSLSMSPVSSLHSQALSPISWRTITSQSPTPVSSTTPRCQSTAIDFPTADSSSEPLSVLPWDVLTYRQCQLKLL